MFDEKTKQLYLDAIADYTHKKLVYDKMYDYCITGKTDAYREYKHNNNRSNLKVRTNFIKKFIKEEVNYLLGNDITYTSKSGDSSIIDVLENQTSHWSSGHDKEVYRDLETYGTVYELYYTDTLEIGDKEEITINAKLVSPRDGYLLKDEFGKPLAFFRFFKKKFDKTKIQYIDIYTKDYIYHCDYALNQADNKQDLTYKTDNVTPNIFGEIPVSEAKISKYEGFDTLFNELKDLVDAYQTNLSDIVNEISDYRLAYLIFLGCQIDAVNKDENGKTQLDHLKEKGAMSTGANAKESDVKFLTKDINDTFVQNTLTTLKDNIYEISNHINTNEKMQSNLSGSAVKNRLIGLMQIISDGESRFSDILLQRHYFIFKLYNKLNNTSYDFRDISSTFTINVPQDDLLSAQTLSQLPDGTVSKATGRKLLSFINNIDREKELVRQEQEEELSMYDVGGAYEGKQEPETV